FDNAQRLQNLGVARWLRKHQPASALAQALSGLLADPRAAQACAEWRERLRPAPDALARAADAVQSLAD
ncbi:MAG: glycosyltransferase, partial [Burkholderiales bacterium]|nr:glycosyltransferase [Burkholderiales bacterium]